MRPLLIVLALVGLLPHVASAQSGLAPRAVPAFTTYDYEGRPVEWSALVGKVYLVDFWATWCTPCHVTLPELQMLHKKYSDKGDFAVLGMTLERGAGGIVRARKFVEEVGVTYPLFNDAGQSGRAHQAFGVNGIPDLFLVDAEGRIVQRWVGSDTDFAEVGAAVEALLAKTREGAKKAS